MASLERADGTSVLETANGTRYTAQQVIIATGAYQRTSRRSPPS